VRVTLRKNMNKKLSNDKVYNISRLGVF
jgi:hypothetical protein